MKYWRWFMAFLMAGNLLMGRSFSYIGVQSLKLFIGEASVALFVLTHPRQTLDRWCTALATSGPLCGFAWMFLIFLSYGIIELMRGIQLGYDRLIALQTLVFNFYPIALFIGLTIAKGAPDYLPRFIRGFAWVHGIYGVAYIAYLTHVNVRMPGSPWIPIFGQPSGSAISLLGLICYEPRLRKVALPVAMNAFVLLGMQVRAEWLGFFAAVLLRSVLHREFGFLIRGVGIVIALLVIGFITDFSFKGTSQRGGTVSARHLIGRAIAPIDEELAAEYRGSYKSTDAATFEWRTIWWRDIRREIYKSFETIALGFGYGFPLPSVTTVAMPHVPGAPVRTPHSIFYYTLGYTGLIGVAIFFMLQFEIARLLLSSYRLTGDSFGLIACCAIFVWAFFDAAFESPYRAIPYYLFAGIAAAPVADRSITVSQPRALWSRIATPVSATSIRRINHASPLDRRA